MANTCRGFSLLNTQTEKQTHIMRKITEIIIHCSDSKPNQDIDAATINIERKNNNWESVNYHYLIKHDGKIQTGRPIKQKGPHCYGHNNNSIGICYEGGMVLDDGSKYYKDTRTPEQKKAMKELVMSLLHAFPSIKRITPYYKSIKNQTEKQHTT